MSFHKVKCKIPPQFLKTCLENTRKLNSRKFAI